jgi:hypothetical protein
MTPRLIGEHPLAKDVRGRLRTGIGTVFPHDNVIVTLPGMIHAMQREAYLDLLDREGRERGEAPLSREARQAIWREAVDLILEQERSEETADEDGSPKVEDRILIRPDPDCMALAFAADELLRELDPPVPVWQVFFQAVRNAQVHDAVYGRGQAWRITPLPTSAPQMRQMIAASRTRIAGQDIYYHNKTTGTRLLTCHEFARLSELGPEGLRQHLAELQGFSDKQNSLGNPEVGFFLAGRGFTKQDLAGYDFSCLTPDELTAVHQTLAAKFCQATPADLRQDDPGRETWRSRMFAALIGERDEAVPEETMLGLSSEFFMQIEWLPGARIDNGELLVDPCFQQLANVPEHKRPCDQKTLGFIFNFIREFGSLEYVNSRRDVYIAVLRESGAAGDVVKIIRMQKRGVCEHLDEGKDLLQAMIQSDQYTEYVLDRRLACRQLGMNLTQRILARKVSETYSGKQRRYHGITVLSPYFERDYSRGIATDKMPASRFENEAYAVRFASLLGRAAAPNLIVGRCDAEGQVVFDDGDEVVLEAPDGLPHEIVLSDQMGTFANCTSPLADFAADYAKPVNDRLRVLARPAVFAEAYLAGFQEHFTRIREEYGKRRSAFDALFRDRPLAPGPHIALRWLEVLRRLDETDPQQLTEQIRSHVIPPGTK